MQTGKIEVQELFDLHGGTLLRGGGMGSSEHPLQQHRSGWTSCAIWDPCVAGDESPTRKSQVPGCTFWGLSVRLFLRLFLVRTLL